MPPVRMVWQALPVEGGRADEKGQVMTLTHCSHCGAVVQRGTCTNSACPLSRKQKGK